MRLIRYLQSRFGPRPIPKTRECVEYAQPVYFNRHAGRNFMVLGTGPTLQDYGEKIKRFIEDRNLVTIGVNHITPFVYPTYHGFTNRRRFAQFAATVDPNQSRALVPILFSDELIKRYLRADPELIMWRPLEEPDYCEIDGEGIIHHMGTSSTVMMLVAYAMGAENVFVAGVEGNRTYLQTGQGLSYTDMTDQYKQLSPRELKAKYSYWADIQEESLKAISAWVGRSGRKPFTFVTPGRYDDYYDSRLLESV